MRRRAVTLLAAIILLPATLVLPAHAGVAPVDEGPPVTNALAGFFGATDTLREAGAVPGARALSSHALVPLQAEPDAADDVAAQRETFAQSGLTITDSRTVFSDPVVVRDQSNRGQGKAADRRRSGGASAPTVVETEVTTFITSVDVAGQVVESSWTDMHRITLEAAGAGYVIVKEERLAPPPEPAAIADRSRRPLTPADESSGVFTDQDGDSEEAAAPTMTTMAAIQPALNVTNFVNYALHWTRAPQGASMNPAYPNEPNNCANFASQALHHGGWSLKNGVNSKDRGNWHYNLTGPAGASWTWVNSGWLYEYARSRAGWSKHSNVYNARAGDLIFVDWDPKGVADGSLDHTMVVTGVTTGPYSTGLYMPLISQKSSNRHHIPLATSIQLAKEQGKTKIVWYALKRI